MQKGNENGRRGKRSMKYFCVCVIRIFLVVGDGLLAVELDPHKATAKQTGRAARWVLIRVFLTKQSDIAIRIIAALISGLGQGSGIRRQLSARELFALQKGGGRGLLPCAKPGLAWLSLALQAVGCLALGGVFLKPHGKAVGSEGSTQTIICI